MKIGVLGAGHLGKIHLNCIKEIDNYELIGFYDTDKENAKQVEQDFAIQSFSSIEALIEAVEIVDIVTPTISHFDYASMALRKSKHVFIEKPIVATPAEARELIEIARVAHTKVQVGHVERFNPAFLAMQDAIANPMFIEAHRLSPFNPRGTDVPVILDLMIHDIDIVLSVVKSEVKSISASGVHVISDTPDIANARIEFENGCVANLTASRISMKKMRKTRFFQKDAYIAVDFLEKKTEIIKMKELVDEQHDPLALVFDPGNGLNRKQIMIYHPEIQPVNAIKMELESFYHAITNDSLPPVTIQDGYNALDVAYQILEKIAK
ncbi:MAG: Gfo/Idh/MocA family oxidoreductase [Bacteroidales bacterium]|nr:Gfo/Idh/MocA family oxidoreductase [Bacteroidales bacterium]